MKNDQHLLWEEMTKILSGMLNKDIFQLWFRPVQAKAVKENTLILSVPNDFSLIWLQDNYKGLLKDVLSQASGRQMELEFVVESLEPLSSPTFPLASAPDPIIEVHESREKERTGEFKLNQQYTFENFVVGPSSHHAHAAALAVAQAPAKAYNPLFIYGGVGLGKTHLMQAVGQYVLLKRKTTKVAYVSSERFLNEYIDAVQNNKVVAFRKKYRSTDILLIDDIHFLAGKERLQEEFFHTFNTLHDSHKQIVLSSDRPASEIANLEHRLVSRFEWGLVTELQPPDTETRVAILRKKAQHLHAQLPPEIINFLAEKIKTNIRRLEGALIRVASYASLTGKSLTLDIVEHLLRDTLLEEARTCITIDMIQKRVAEYYDVRIADMTSKRRPANIALPRQIAMYLSRQLTPGSLNEIGEAFGGRDHGTVLHACRLVDDKIKKDENFKQQVSFLTQQLQR